MKKERTSWINYMSTLHKARPDYDLLKLQDLNQTFLLNQFSHGLFYHCLPAIYLMDYATGKYISMSQSSQTTIGSKADYFIDGGIDFTLEIYHKDDMRLFNEQIFPDRLSFLNSIPHQEHQNYLFSYNYRLKKSSGEYVNLLQRSCIIKSDEGGNPEVSLGVVFSMQDYTNENPVIHTVEKIRPGDTSQPLDLINKKKYYLCEEDQLFSKREREVLLWMAEGLSSKQIADKMCLSEHTVINHRRNMMEKTGIGNATALVSYALRLKII